MKKKMTQRRFANLLNEAHTGKREQIPYKQVAINCFGLDKNCSRQASRQEIKSAWKKYLDGDSHLVALIDGIWESHPANPDRKYIARTAKQVRAGKEQRPRKPKRAKAKLPENFYKTQEWRSLRYKAFEENGNACQCCGASPKTGAILHVDHIKPKSIYPELALELSNLQILCEDCNLGKLHLYETDWR